MHRVDSPDTLNHFKLNMRYALVLFLIFPRQSFSNYYETLPKGVRMALYRNIRTSNIESSFNHLKREQEYLFKVDLNSKTLESTNDAANKVFQQIKSISQEAYEQLTFGEYQAKGDADVNIDGYAAAYGLTNRTTVYGIFPWWKAQINFEVQRTRQNNYKEVANALENEGDSTSAQILAQVTPWLPDVNENVVQSLIVNTLNYKPLGSWGGEGIGDIEIGVLHRFTDWKQAGLAFAAGLILPTGREDDPDNIVDFGFGDGQTDLFFEFRGGYQVPNTRWSLNAFTRFTYQFEHTRIMRVVESNDFPLGIDKGVFKEKLGNRYDFDGTTNFQVTPWLGLSTGYVYTHITQAKYESPFIKANQINAANTEVHSHSLRGGLHFSTLPYYKSGDFFLPFDTNITALSIVGGKNQNSFNRYDIEFRFYF